MNAIQLHIPPEDLEVAFDEYEAGETITSVADMLGIPVQRFKSLYESARGKPEIEKTEEMILMPKKKTRKQLSSTSREKILKALANGVSATSIAESYGISSKTVYNLKHRSLEKPPVKKTKAEKKVISDAEAEVTKTLKKAAAKPELTVTFEADYIVVRIPRKTILSSLLRDLI